MKATSSEPTPPSFVAIYRVPTLHARRCTPSLPILCPLRAACWHCTKFTSCRVAPIVAISRRDHVVRRWQMVMAPPGCLTPRGILRDHWLRERRASSQESATAAASATSTQRRARRCFLGLPAACPRKKSFKTLWPARVRPRPCTRNSCTAWLSSKVYSDDASARAGGSLPYHR